MAKDIPAETACFSVKGQIVIPRNIRKQFDIENGTRALVYVDSNRIILKPLTARYFRAMRSLLKET